jgi:formate-dependent nitrite reductase membrane component NrfD
MPKGLRCTWIGRMVGRLARPAGLASAAIAPGIATYTAVLLSHTAVPAWHEAHPYLPFVFSGSAAASGGGLGMLLAPVEESGPARRLAVMGAALEVVGSQLVERRLGVVSEAFTTGKPHRLRTLAKCLNIGGAVGAVVSGRNRAAVAASGVALLAGSVLQRFGEFEAGAESTRDPKYVVVPQREQQEARRTVPMTKETR